MQPHAILEASTPQARTTSAVPVEVSNPCLWGLEIVPEGIDPLAVGVQALQAPVRNGMEEEDGVVDDVTVPEE